MFSWKSATLSVSNNHQSKISRIAHKSNERRTITSIAYPTGNRSQAPIAVDVSIKSVWRTLPHSGFASRARLIQLPPHNPLDLNLAFVLAGLREIVGHLQPQPRFRATAERLVETDPISGEIPLLPFTRLLRVCPHRPAPAQRRRTACRRH